MRNLFELAFQRKKIIDSFETKTKLRVAEHFCKLLLWKNADEYKHWSDEIFGWLQDISLMKSKNGKFLKKDDYMKYFFLEPIDCVGDMQRFLNATIENMQVFKNYSTPDENINPKEAFDSYYKWSSNVSDLLNKGEYNYIKHLKLLELI